MDQIGKGLTGSRHGRGRAPTTSKQWTDENFSTHGTRNTFGNTTSRDDGQQLPPIPQFIYFTSFFKFFDKFSFIWTSFCYDNFQYPFKPKGASTFSTTLNFMEEHSDYTMFYYYCKITTIRAWTLHGLTTSLVRQPYKACGP